MSNEKTIKFKVSLGIGLSNADQNDVIDSGITRSEWDAMTPEKQQEAQNEAWEEWAWEYIDGGCQVVEDDD